MTLTLAPPPVAAVDRFARNGVAAGLDLPFPEIEFCPGRDGATTAKRDGRWLAGCSVPRRAAEVMLRHEHWPARSLCLVAPTHGQQIAATLDRLGPTRALIAVVPVMADLADVLACVDVAADLLAGRLHIAWDEPSLRAVFARWPGLAVPGQMVRLGDADPAAVTAAMPWLQATFSALTVDHAHRLTTAGRDATPAAGTCVLVGRQFRLNADAGDALARLFDGDGTARVFDIDRPSTSSLAAAAEAVAAAGVVIAERPRPAWAVADRPWIAWLTTPVVPPFEPAHAADALLLADAAWRPLARAAGWPDARVAVAGPPADPIAFNPGAAPALLLDLPDLETPADVAELTGQRLVWEAIREELTHDPFAVGDDAARYALRAPARLKLEPIADFPTRRFVDKLIAPAVALGVARWLVGQGIGVTIHGRGWPKDDAALAGRIAGPVESRDAFRAAVAAAGGRIDPSLPATGGAVAALGVPVVRTFGRTPQRVLQDIAALRAGRLPAEAINTPICRAAIDALLATARV